MKQEDIDKKIGMPDVDAEWAKFEREVINPKTASRKTLYWGIGIAASIALAAGIFLFGDNTEKSQQTIAQQNTHTIQTSSAEKTIVETPVESIASPEKDEPVRIETKQRPSTELLAEATPPTTEEKVYDCGEVMPYFPGGDRALLEFVKNNLRYPDLAMEYGVRGRVVMTFKVDTIGQVSNIKPARFLLRYDTLYMNRVPAGHQVTLKQQIDSLLSKECTRILCLMPRWTPGSLFGETVSVKYSLPVQFNATDAERQTYLAQKQTANDEPQDHIAGLTIVPTSADMGTDNTMRLTGTKVAGRDTVRIGGRLNDSILAVIDGQPLMITLNSRLTTEYFNRYLYEHHQFVNQIVVYKDEDNKRPYIEKYGERAKYGVLVISTVPDTLCDAYVQQHPELMQTRRRVEGYVIDEETEEPLPDTWIHCFDNAGAVTDSTGHFALWLPRTDVMLQAVRVGYIKVRITQPADTVFTIRMKSNVRIRDVKVIPKKEREEYKFHE